MKSKMLLGALCVLATSCPAAVPADGVQTAGAVEGAALLRLPTDAAEESRVHVVVVAIDGVRFQDVALEESDDASSATPNLRKLVRRGVGLGSNDTAPFLASGPNFVSLPGYTELLTGAESPCTENDCDERPARTLVDEASALAGGAAVIASWERIERIATGLGERSSAVVSAGRSGGRGRERVATNSVARAMLDAGARAEPFPGHDDYRPDLFTAALATHYFEDRRPAFLFVALGDTDEYAHRGDKEGYLAALRFADQTVGALVEIASRWEGHETTFVITTDHGRSDGFRDHGRSHPESQRSFLVAAGPRIAARGTLRGGQPRYLKDIAPTVRDLLALPGAGEIARGGESMREIFTEPKTRIAALSEPTARRR
jgi:hypothetical protein